MRTRPPLPLPSVILILAGALVFAGGLRSAQAAPEVITRESARIRIQSTAPDTDFARPLAVGDFDGDGADDIAIGQSDSYPEGVANVYVLRGTKRNWGPTRQEIDLSTRPPDRLIRGGSQDINLPTSMAVGDLNGDGFDDLAMTASFASPRGRTYAGIAYVVLGGTNFYDGPTTLTLTAPGGASVVSFDGAVAGGDLGSQSIFGGLDAHGLAMGDLNGDGIDDLAVGAHLAEPKGRAQGGSVYVVFGKTTFAGGQNYDLLAADFRVDGARQYYETGTTIMIADVTDDLIGDLVIGCDIAGEDTYFLSTEGIVYLLRGRTTWPAVIDLLTTWDLKIRGAVDETELGGSLAAADMNRDGVRDLCIGAVGRFGSAPAGDSIGAAEIHYGKTSLGSPSATIRPALPDVLWMGAEGSSYMGYTAVSGRFIDPDHDSLAAAAVFADYSPTGETNGFVEVLGSRDNWPANTILDTPTAPAHEYRIVGPDGGRFGFGLAAGDTNGDGIDELLVGAPFLGQGEVYLFQLPVSGLCFTGQGWWYLQ